MLVKPRDKPTLLTLPAELREMIYEYTFGEECFREPLHASILLTCHQTYNEALPLYYKHSTFFFSYFTDAVNWFARRPVEIRERISDLVYFVDDKLFLFRFIKAAGVDIKLGVLKERRPWGDSVADLSDW